MKQVKQLIKTNWLLLSIAAVLILTLLILTPFRIKHSQKESSPSQPIANVVASAPVDSPDARSEVAVPILMYHHIRNFNNPTDKIGTALSVSPENFKAQIDYLKNNGYTTITFSDFMAFPAKKLPDKPIILTFDDGYQDAYDNAFVPLKNNGQVGVFYIISNFLGQPDFMTTDEVKTISANKMEIGSHTLSHPDLTKIKLVDANAQIVQSKSVLENLIGQSVISFCYPSGQNNSSVNTAVEKAGYLTATTTDMAISSTSQNKYKLSRLRINPSDSLAYFADKIKNYKRK